LPEALEGNILIKHLTKRKREKKINALILKKRNKNETTNQTLFTF